MLYLNNLEIIINYAIAVIVVVMKRCQIAKSNEILNFQIYDNDFKSFVFIDVII